MKDTVKDFLNRFRVDQKKRQRTTAVLLVMSLLVASSVAWQLRLTGISLAGDAYCGIEEHTHTEACFATQLVCGREEGEATTESALTYRLLAAEQASTGAALDYEPSVTDGHVHTDACYETVCICGKEEHVHDLACYADISSDLETADDWEATLPEELSGKWGEDILAVAESQLDYTESSQNYIVNEQGQKKGYTRYGEWYGNPYGDWCAMFVSFCLHYADIPQEAVPYGAGCYAWATELEELGIYETAEDYVPVPGDLVFFAMPDTESAAEGSQPNHVGIVTAYLAADEESGVDEDTLYTIEGNRANSVCEREYPLTDDAIVGYVNMTAAYDRAVELDLLPEDLEEKPLRPIDGNTVAVTGAKDFLYEDDNFVITLHMEGTVAMPTTASALEFTGMTEPDAAPLLHAVAPDVTMKAPAAIMGADAEFIQPETLPDWNDITLAVLPVDETSEEYANLLLFAQEQGGEDELFSLMAMRFCFNAQGQQLDVSDCTITATITAKAPICAPEEQPVKLLAAKQTLRTAMAAQSITENASVNDADAMDEADLAAEPTNTQPAEPNGMDNAASASDGVTVAPAPEAEIGVVLSVFQQDAQQITELDNVLLTTKENIVPTVTVPIKADGILALAASQTANPKFTVQYYAYVDQVNTSGANPLAIIDTSGSGNGTGGNLPQNGATLTMKNLYLNSSGGRFYVATNKNTVVPVYKEKGYEYIQAPNLTYFNRLYENGHYALKEVWILNAGKSSASTNKADWTVYTDPANLHFTNRQASVNDKTILINENAVIRLVFDTTASGYNNAATFYDYDITDGKFYKAANLIGGTYATQSDGVPVFGYTNEQGINSGGNYTGTGTKLAFGNMNTGTKLGNLFWNGQELNKFNETNRNTGGKGCTFGLVTSLDKNGHIVYAGGVNAPKLFNENTATGKTAFQNYSLDFKRDGDTYTLSAVNGTRAQNLDSFIHPQSYSIFTNNFWPMDSAPTYGAAGHDLKFGDNSLKDNRRYFDQHSSASYNQFPVSDDGPDHNSYFGMQYAVQFALTEDYIGPLEYYFFGDDDMWVFLDGKLVCDIGGVHSSVGEYVNLWDYIKKGDAGTHTLSFFYTERGASGSSCYMRFTLPSVSSITPEQNTGTLRVEKEVTGPKTGDEEFNFQIHFTDAAGNNLQDDYSYNRYDKAGNLVKTDVIIYDGGTFQLKDGEYIIVRYLPVGAKYHITEEDPEPDIYKTTVSTNNGEAVAGREASGTIQLLTEEKVHYINETFYELPETGGSGTHYYTVGGLLLMLTALLCGYRRRRRERRADI